jgi:hypothetical protein
MTVHELQKQYGYLDWEAYFKQMLPSETGKSKLKDLKLIVAEPSYLKGLQGIFKKHSHETIRYYTVRFKNVVRMIFI